MYGKVLKRFPVVDRQIFFQNSMEAPLTHQIILEAQNQLVEAWVSP